MSKLIILGIGGDSITGCHDVGTCYPFQGLNVTPVGDCGDPSTQAPFTYYSSNIVAKNLGISGSRIASGANNMTTIAQTYGDIMVTSSGRSVAGGGLTAIPTRRFLYSVFPGSNDACLGPPDNTVAEFVTEVVTFCAARKTAGWNAVIIGTVLPRESGMGALTEVNRAAYNSTITAPGWAAANGIDGIFDLASDSIMGNVASNTNPTYYNSDQIHPTTAGHARLAPIWLATVNAVIAGL